MAEAVCARYKIIQGEKKKFKKKYSFKRTKVSR